MAQVRATCAAVASLAPALRVEAAVPGFTQSWTYAISRARLTGDDQLRRDVEDHAYDAVWTDCRRLDPNGTALQFTPLS